VTPRRLTRDESGATVVEFALVAPVLVTLLLALFDTGYNLYTASVLQGTIQKAARDSTIEGTTPGALDAKVGDAVKLIAGNATITYARKNYASFSDVGTPEDYTDVNGDGACDNGEPYEDANNNGSWDQDRGTAGQGGARDAVLYTVHVSYPRAFPIGGFLGLPQNHEMETSTVLRNQPYGPQTVAQPGTGHCT
jgi:Flp pilus assembly protein TadG